MLGEQGEEQNSETKSGFNPWMVVLITAPIPLLLFVLFLYRWHQQNTEFERVKNQYVERQNTALAYEAINVSKRINDLLSAAQQDLQALALVAPQARKWQQFYRTHERKLTRYDEKKDRIELVPAPFYNEMSFVGPDGIERLRLRDGKQVLTKRTLQNCREGVLCDRKLWEQISRGPIGQIRFGSLMRWYTPKGTPEIEKEAHYPLALRTKEGVFFLGIDYRHMKQILYLPTFPYRIKRNLYQAYLEGNYIYFVDSETNILAHPKYWHVTGVDANTGKRVTPVVQDEDLGKRPLNVQQYKGQKLRDYFGRLLQVSFVQKSVDIFKAPNLTGTIRVLSVSPILFSGGAYKRDVFGHVLTGCNVEFFKKPKERYLPYY